MRCVVKLGVGRRDEVEIGLVNGVICSRLTGVGAAGVAGGWKLLVELGRKMDRLGDWWREALRALVVFFFGELLDRVELLGFQGVVQAVG